MTTLIITIYDLPDLSHTPHVGFREVDADNALSAAVSSLVKSGVIPGMDAVASEFEIKIKKVS